MCSAVCPGWTQGNFGQWNVGSCQQFYSLPVFGLCELRLWDQSRSADAIRSTMFTSTIDSKESTEEEARLVGDWKLNDAVGVMTSDSSPYCHSAVLWEMTFVPCTRKPIPVDDVTPVKSPVHLTAAALRKSVTYTNGECLVVYHGLADWVAGNPGYVGLYQVRHLCFLQWLKNF